MKTKTLEDVASALAQAMQALADVLAALNQESPEPQPSTRLYSYNDLAQMLGKSKSTVRQWVCEGQFGEPVKVGSSTMVTQAGVDKFITDHSGPVKKRSSKAHTYTRKPNAYKGPPLGI